MTDPAPQQELGDTAGDESVSTVQAPSERVELDTDAPAVAPVNDDDVVLRHVIKQWTNEDETPKSVAFKPTPKDQNHLSTDHGVSASAAYAAHAKRVGKDPAGTWGLGVAVVRGCHADMEVLKDGGTNGLHASHASIVFPGSAVSKTQLRSVHERIAQTLKSEAVRRKRQYPPA